MEIITKAVLVHSITEIAIKLKKRAEEVARMVLEQFTKLCSSELGGSIPSDAVTVLSANQKQDKEVKDEINR